MRSLLLIFTFLFSSLSSANLEDGIYAHINTNKGEIIVELAYEKAPLTVINFIGLAEGTKESNKELGVPFYDGISFHRVIEDFMIQGGDPMGNGTGGPGYNFSDEFSDLIHDKPGILSMANSGPNTNGSQFFITHVATPWLDGKHSVFGFVVDGMDVVNSIKQGDTIESLVIKRIGEDANQFLANEESFRAQMLVINEGLIAQQELRIKDFENYVSSNYSNALKDALGIFSEVNNEGNGIKPKKGQVVTVDIALIAYCCQVIREPGNPIQFTIGSGDILGLIDSSVGQMSIGEKRTIIALYEDVFGNASSQQTNIPQDSYLIFELNLIEAKGN